VFSLDRQLVYPVQADKVDYAIYCRNTVGPHFGYNNDLSAYSEPFNTNNSRSNANQPTYKIGADANGNSLLTGKKDNFSPVEIETYLLK